MRIFFEVPFIPFFTFLFFTLILFWVFRKNDKKFKIIFLTAIILTLTFFIIDFWRVYFADGIELIGH